MKKIFLILFITITLCSCSSEKETTKPSIYKSALDKTKAIQENVNNQNQLNSEVIK